MSKLRAFLLHLAASIAVIALLFGIILYVWYPGPAFRMVGAIDPLIVLVGVDVVLGPSMTLLLYRAGKPGLKFDMSVIFAIQLIALAYGAHTLYSQRPHYLVFAIDRFNVIVAAEIDAREIRRPGLRQRRLGVLTQAYARMPTDPDEKARFIESVIFDKQPDLHARPEFWEPISDGADAIRAAALPIEDFVPVDEEQARRVGRARARHSASHERIGIVPVFLAKRDMAVMIDLDTLELIDAIAVNAWRDQQPPQDGPGDEAQPPGG